MLVRNGLFIPYRRRRARLIAGLILTATLLMLLALPQHVFANHSDTSHQTISGSLPQNQSPTADELTAVDTEKDRDGSWRVVRMRVTAYCPCSKCCGKYSDGITACHHKIQNGDRFVAADKRYPFGTKMIIPGYNEGKPIQVKDRGGAIKDNKLDVFFNTHEEALAWGVQYLDVLVKVQ